MESPFRTSTLLQWWVEAGPISTIGYSMTLRRTCCAQQRTWSAVRIASRPTTWQTRALAAKCHRAQTQDLATGRMRECSPLPTFAPVALPPQLTDHRFQMLTRVLAMLVIVLSTLTFPGLILRMAIDLCCNKDAKISLQLCRHILRNRTRQWTPQWTGCTLRRWRSEAFRRTSTRKASTSPYTTATRATLASRRAPTTDEAQLRAHTQ